MVLCNHVSESALLGIPESPFKSKLQHVGVAAQTGSQNPTHSVTVFCSEIRLGDHMPSLSTFFSAIKQSSTL